MLTALVIIFVVAYAAIAFEHPLKINKSASALVGAGLLWTIYAVNTGDVHLVGEQLSESLVSTAQIVFFLMGAMAIVEVVDAHNGFEVITSRIKTTKLSSLMWLVGLVTFFLSAILDNLTTTIVMVSLMKKLLDQREDVAMVFFVEHPLQAHGAVCSNPFFVFEHRPGVGEARCQPWHQHADCQCCRCDPGR